MQNFINNSNSIINTHTSNRYSAGNCVIYRKNIQDGDIMEGIGKYVKIYRNPFTNAIQYIDIKDRVTSDRVLIVPRNGDRIRPCPPNTLMHVKNSTQTKKIEKNWEMVNSNMNGGGARRRIKKTVKKIVKKK